MSAHTPGPWRVVFRESAHRKDSPYCLEHCGNGEVPVRIYHEETTADWPEPEMHVMEFTNIVDDIVAADGTHVVCLGHDYNDAGTVSAEDAILIAAAPELLYALKQLASPVYQQGRDVDIEEQAQAAIAKAEGR